ncbi:hypothetical protein Nepgr_003956 [Nepenthes gracilis]|uniref:Alkaline/neutral invertase n=1 Tax=Nepenthes gracilis TaxID=150966 RepID=A0AAD3S0I7_NEPGR|nr:hypothetical protein Nepgr_003956 [Nepenthes gracilis]
MFASFKVQPDLLDDVILPLKKILDPNSSNAAIGCIAPVDPKLWWIIQLHAYERSFGDLLVQERVDVQIGIQRILKICLASGFDMFQTLLVTDEDESHNLTQALNNLMVALSFHVKELNHLRATAILMIVVMVMSIIASIAIVSFGEGTSLALARNFRPPYPISIAGRNNVRHSQLDRNASRQQRACSSFADDFKPCAPSKSSGKLQEWFHEDLASPMLSSGVCTKAFQFEVSSTPGSIVPTITAANNTTLKGQRSPYDLKIAPYDTIQLKHAPSWPI